MKAILEQNFDELYAQVEERVKCIKPVKQIDTYTKTLIWTSLHEIVTDVFGNSRFIWMIETGDSSFVIQLFDKYKIIPTRYLVVQYLQLFNWPTRDEILNMSADGLIAFKQLCESEQITQSDVSRHYGMSVTWFNTLIKNRSNGVASRGSEEFHKKQSKILMMHRAKRLTDTDIDLLLLHKKLVVSSIPVSRHVLASVFNTTEYKVRCLFCGRPKNSRMYIDYLWETLDPYKHAEIIDTIVEKYISTSIKYMAAGGHAFKTQSVVKLGTGISHADRVKQLTMYLEDKKEALLLEKRNLLNTQVILDESASPIKAFSLTHITHN